MGGDGGGGNSACENVGIRKQEVEGDTVQVLHVKNNFTHAVIIIFSQTF